MTSSTGPSRASVRADVLQVAALPGHHQAGALGDEDDVLVLLRTDPAAEPQRPGAGEDLLAAGPDHQAAVGQAGPLLADRGDVAEDHARDLLVPPDGCVRPAWSAGAAAVPRDSQTVRHRPASIDSPRDRRPRSRGRRHGRRYGPVDHALDVLRRVWGYDAFRARPARGRRPRRRRRRRPGPHADRRRQVAVLPGPRAGPRGHRRGRLAAHRADAGPGRRAAHGRGAGRLPQLHAPAARAPGGRGRLRRRGARPAVPGARRRCGARARSACSTGAGSRCSRSTRRTASPSGATTSGPTTWPCRCCTSAGPTCRGSRSPPPRPPRRARRSSAGSTWAGPGSSSPASTGPTSATASCPRTEPRRAAAGAAAHRAPR